MSKHRVRAISGHCLSLVAAAALAASGNGEHGMSLTLTSTAFSAGNSIPAAHTCDGKNVSPPLFWSGLPPATKSLALIVDDPDAPDPAAPKRTWVHWVLYNIPSGTAGLPLGVNSED